MQFRKTFIIIEDTFSEAGQQAPVPLRKVAIVGIMPNRYAGKPYEQDLEEHIQLGSELGKQLGELGTGAMGSFPIESYGKGAVVGINGEQEHGVTLLTTLFGDALRNAAGGGRAWISSASKRAAPGATIDIPLAYKDALFVRSHYDAMTVHLPDAPLADEIAVIACFASGGRLNDRAGGLRTSEATAGDGLR